MTTIIVVDAPLVHSTVCATIASLFDTNIFSCVLLTAAVAVQVQIFFLGWLSPSRLSRRRRRRLQPGSRRLNAAEVTQVQSRLVVESAR